MIQFNVQNISKYRGQLMGIATLLVIFGHSVGNGVAMPRWMESLCGLSSVGVDIFLLVSGLELWYSLTSLNGNNFERVNIWYLRRYKRILIPYLIIIGFQKVLSVLHGMPLLQALFELSTLSYWVNHQGAWFIAMLIPVYALTPLHYRICNKVSVNVIICNSVTIGKGAIVGAGSIVTKDIPPYQVWAGNPARYIKDREH